MDESVQPGDCFVWFRPLILLRYISCSSRSSGLFRPSGARLGCSFCFASVPVVRSIYLLCCRASPLLVLAAHVEAPLVRSSRL